MYHWKKRKQKENYENYNFRPFLRDVNRERIDSVNRVWIVKRRRHCHFVRRLLTFQYRSFFSQFARAMIRRRKTGVTDEETGREDEEDSEKTRRRRRSLSHLSFALRSPFCRTFARPLAVSVCEWVIVVTRLQTHVFLENEISAENWSTQHITESVITILWVYIYIYICIIFYIA